MHDRLREFSLSLHPDKTRLIEFGRFAAQELLRSAELIKPRDLHVPWLRAHLRQISTRRLPGQEEVTRGSYENEAPGDQGGAATTNKQADPRDWEMACSSRRRLFRISRRADQWPGAIRVPISRQTSLASATMSAQPESQSAMDADDETGGRVSPEATDPSSLAQRAVRRQTPKVGAECPNWARSDLSGGRPAMDVPCTLRVSGK